MAKYSDEEIIASQCVEHAEAMQEQQNKLLKIANRACELYGIKISKNMTTANIGQFHLLDCPVYKSATAFDENIEKALNGDDATSDRRREFYNKRIIKKLEKQITCPICKAKLEKQKAKK